MGDSTLRPTPSYNANIPVVTAAGGTNYAYKDPNSPESILKKTTELNAQTAVDTKFDAAMSPYHEGFATGIRQWLTPSLGHVQGEGFGSGIRQWLTPSLGHVQGEGFATGIRQSEGFQCNCGCHRCPMQGTKGCPMQGTKGCPMQGTKGCPHCRRSKDAQKRITNLQVLLFITILLFIAVVSLDKPTPACRIFLFTLCIILIGLILNQWAAV